MLACSTALESKCFIHSKFAGLAAHASETSLLQVLDDDFLQCFTVEPGVVSTYMYGGKVVQDYCIR